MTRDDLQASIDNYEEFLKSLRILLGEETSGGRLLDTLKQCRFIFDLCPFKEGDEAVLNRTPTIDEHTAPGWIRARHFMVEGAAVKVTKVQFYGGKFSVYVEFERESWIDPHTLETNPIERKAQYIIPVTWLTKLGLPEIQDLHEE